MGFFQLMYQFHLRSATIGQPTSDHYPEERTSTYVNSYYQSITEQVLSPYCVLQYVDKRQGMDDPSGYTCIVRSRKLIRILDAIEIKVPHTKVGGASGLSAARPSLFELNVLSS
jgi:hypothetical protein